MEIRRTGNTGFIDTGEGQLISFAMGKGWSPSSISFSRPESWQTRKIRVAGVDIVPMGANNDLPGDVQRLLDNFYGGEGIMGKIQGLQWGEGPRFFEEAIDSENNRFYRKWILMTSYRRIWRVGITATICSAAWWTWCTCKGSG